MSNWAGDITIGLGWVYYDGPVGHTEFHQHYAAQICFPVASPLQIETRGQILNAEDVLVIGSNISHRLSAPSQTAKILYIDPSLVREGYEKLGAGGVGSLSLSSAQERALEQALAAGPASRTTEFSFELTQLIWPANSDHAALPSIDPRIVRSLEDIDAADDLNITLDRAARAAGLSTGRFRHLFSAQIGMPLKSYLLWRKLQLAIQSLAKDSSLTRAAHIAGFADSAHLSRTFKRTFGLSPNELNRKANVTTRKSGL